MNIYVDFDDCLCETGRFFCELVADMFGKNVPYEKVRFFDLRRSFSLTEDQHLKMMEKGHERETLLSLEETPGASKTVNAWLNEGHNVTVITGRPYNSFEASREWLDLHGLSRVRLFCLDKYGRDEFYKKNKYNLTLKDYYKMKFDYAVEDSPKAFGFFEHLPHLRVLVFDRPWNKSCVFPNENYTRCADWAEIKIRSGIK